MKNIFESENLIELHQQLNEFALHQQNKGGQEAHRIIKNEWDKSNATPRDGDRMDFHQGYDYAMKSILEILHKRFVP